MQTFDAFLPAFFDLFTQKQFRARDFLGYLDHPRRAGDEASIVDNAIVSPLLLLLGFGPGEQVYNQNKKNGRPDFAPEEADYGVCFIVEDKSTALELTLDLDDPESHLSQLSGYVRAQGLRSGWLTNGKRLTVWRFDVPERPQSIIDLDLPTAIDEWTQGGAERLANSTKQALRLLWDQFRKETFADWQRLEREIATELEDWQRQALPVGANEAHQEQLVGSVKTLLQDLQTDARSILDGHLQRYAEYETRRDHLEDNAEDTALDRLEQQRDRVMALLRRVAPLVGLETDEIAMMQADLRELERNPRIFLNTKELSAKVLAVINAARVRKFPDDKKASKPWSKFDNGLTELGGSLQIYGDTAFVWHQRQATLRQANRNSIEVHDNYILWTSLVQETMLGGLHEEQRRDEFALQAAYVVFIRLLLLRVCEDKGILPHRFISDGGLRRWQEDMDRYFIFTNANPYDTLLDMAYENVQNIYAHFFTGRELFNWYTLKRLRFIRVLYQLSRFNFEDVDADLIGTIYNTYVDRKEKKQKGQYYTPPAIVRYILDETGYISGPAIIGPNKRLIDPACGSGTFLVEAARRLVAAYRTSGADSPRQLLDRVRDNLYGFDLNPFACYLAEVNLLIQVLDLVKLAIEGRNPPRLQRFHIYNVDALAPSSGVLYYARANTLMAEELDIVDRIKDRKDEYATGFAWVVANPPYGAKLTDAYKIALREWMSDVFHGKPDTYVFFFRLALRLLGAHGRLGFITPNTYLMGVHTAGLREQLLASGRLDQIVDLPQGIWDDVNVDCALLFLTAESDLTRRREQQTQVFGMDVRDKLDKLTLRSWKETFAQSQSIWVDAADHDINIRWTPLLGQIEEACRISANGATLARVLRLSDITESSAGIDPYETSAEGKANRYIKPRREVSSHETDWHPLLDRTAFIGRYQLLWGNSQPYIKYGSWLCRPREQRFFDSPKLIAQDMRNRALKRRLVATYDDKKYYHRKNFNNIITKSTYYDLKYLLALFNSSLLNYWYARQFDNVHVTPDYFRQLPIYPADVETQAELVALVDQLLAQNSALSALREQDYAIRLRRDGTYLIEVPYDILLREMQQKDRSFPVLSLFDAQAASQIRLPSECDIDAQISRVFPPSRHPNTIVLRAGQLWLEVDDDAVRRYLLNYLARPQWKGRSWDEINGHALIPETADAFAAFYAEEARIVAEIRATLDSIARTDAAIDERVLDLYGITDPADRQRILGSAPVTEDAELEETATTPGTEPEADSGPESETSETQ